MFIVESLTLYNSPPNPTAEAENGRIIGFLGVKLVKLGFC